MTAAAFIVGLALIALTLQDAFEVVLLPRRVPGRIRFTSLFFRGGWTMWRAAASLTPSGPARERFLSIFGPLAMLALFCAWAAALIIGFGLIQWGGGHASEPAASLASRLYLSGATFFTLGYGDVTPRTDLDRLAAVVEAGVGFGLIALVIGYLPVLYQLFSRREAHVLQLDARAGSPPTAAILLRRHVEAGAVDRLDELLRAWEVWGAELLESHLSYPMLAYYRSQHDDQSWLAALAAVLDACVLVLAGVETGSPLQARMTFAILRQVVVEMARSLRVSGARTGAGVALEETDYLALRALLEASGLAWRSEHDVYDTLAAMRATYAPLTQGLADYLMIPLPGLMPRDDSADHWDQGPRGLIARRLVEGLTEGPAETPVPGRRHGRTLAARLRAKLK
jgi:voltage-gated potassium channel Kch